MSAPTEGDDDDPWLLHAAAIILASAVVGLILAGCAMVVAICAFYF